LRNLSSQRKALTVYISDIGPPTENKWIPKK
jgi:hypothetical protein